MKALIRGVGGFYAVRLQSNYDGYFREFAPYLILLSVAAGLDFLSTYGFMTFGSVDDEFHPVIRMASHLFGPFFGPLIGKLGQLGAVIFVTMTFRHIARYIFIPVTLLYLGAAWYNNWVLHLL